VLNEETTELADKAKSMNDLAKAAREVGATMNSSGVVAMTSKVPYLGVVGQVAPQLFDLAPGSISGPIKAQQTGIVARLVDKQEPNAGEIARNFDQIREQILEQRRGEAFSVFANKTFDDYQKHNRIRMIAKTQPASVAGE
jgi:peptidyl-prolyl cis-trans isomerase D